MNVSELAKQMNVSEADLLAMAHSVKNSIIQDNSSQNFIEANEEDQVELTQAYAIHANKKMQQFTNTYQTNPEARKVFQESIYSQLKKSS